MQFPPFHKFLPNEAIKQLSALVTQPGLTNAIKDAAQKLGLSDAAPVSQFQEILKQAGRWAESMVEPWLPQATVQLTPGVNATGDVFHSRWTTQRIPSNASQLAALLYSSYSEHQTLSKKLTALVMSMTGSQDVIVTPNLSTAIWLTATALAGSEKPVEFVLPRCHCIRLPSGNAQGGVPLRGLLDLAKVTTSEIGSSHDCAVADYQNALTGPHQTLVLCSPMNGDDNRTAGIAAAKSVGASVVHIALDGAMHDLSSLGLASSNLTHQWDLGADFVIVPGNHYLGGPDCGIILGKLDPMKSVRKIAESMGMEADAVTHAMLYEILQGCDSSESWSQTPIGLTLSTTMENLESRGKRLEAQLVLSKLVNKVESEKRKVRLGPAPWNATFADSVVLKVFPKDLTPSALSERLSHANPPVWVTVQSDCVEIVLRSVEPEEDRYLVDAMLDEVEVNS